MWHPLNKSAIRFDFYLLPTDAKKTVEALMITEIVTEPADHPFSSEVPLSPSALL